jgi:hypothetical protein
MWAISSFGRALPSFSGGFLQPRPWLDRIGAVVLIAAALGSAWFFSTVHGLA